MVIEKKQEELEAAERTGCCTALRKRIRKFFNNIRKRFSCLRGSNEEEDAESFHSALSTQSFNDRLDKFVQEEIKKVSEMVLADPETESCVVEKSSVGCAENGEDVTAEKEVESPDEQGTGHTDQ